MMVPSASIQSKHPVLMACRMRALMLERRISQRPGSRQRGELGSRAAAHTVECSAPFSWRLAWKVNAKLVWEGDIHQMTPSAGRDGRASRSSRASSTRVASPTVLGTAVSTPTLRRNTGFRERPRCASVHGGVQTSQQGFNYLFLKMDLDPGAYLSNSLVHPCTAFTDLMMHTTCRARASLVRFQTTEEINSLSIGEPSTEGMSAL